MKKNLLFLFVAFLSLSITSAFSQDKILTMEGAVIDCQIIDDTQILITYEVTNKRGKVKSRSMHKTEVFSIIKEGKNEHIFYSKDEVLGDNFTIEEMKIYLVGEQDAKKSYSTRNTEIIGYVLGAAGGYLAQGSVIVLLITPITYVLYQYLPYIKIKEETMSSIGYKHNDFYMQGYELVARGKKIRAALKSSVIGSLAGAIIYRIIPFS